MVLPWPLCGTSFRQLWNCGVFTAVNAICRLLGNKATVRNKAHARL
jgi:hypothetical protein